MAWFWEALKTLALWAFVLVCVAALVVGVVLAPFGAYGPRWYRRRRRR